MTIAAEVRSSTGTGATRALRKENMVPASLYGNNQEAVSLALSGYDLMMAMKSSEFFTSLQIIKVDGKEHKVFAREIQKHPVSGKILHADLLRFNPKQKITLNVPVHIVDEDKSPGIKIGGLLQMVRQEVALVCPADNLVHGITFSVAGKEIGDSVHMSEALDLPEGVVPEIDDRDFTIASIISTRTSKTDDSDDSAEASDATDAASGTEKANS